MVLRVKANRDDIAFSGTGKTATFAFASTRKDGWPAGRTSRMYFRCSHSVPCISVSLKAPGGSTASTTASARSFASNMPISMHAGRVTQ